MSIASPDIVNRTLTPLPTNTCALCPIYISTACATYFCSQFNSKSRLLTISSHSPTFWNASFSSCIHSLGAFVMMNTFLRGPRCAGSHSFLSAAFSTISSRICITFSTICGIVGKQCLMYISVFSGVFVPHPAPGGGKNLSGNDGNVLNPFHSLDQLARCPQCCAKSPRRMCRAIIPGRGVRESFLSVEKADKEEGKCGRKDMKDDCGASDANSPLFLSYADKIKGDQLSFVRIGE